MQYRRLLLAECVAWWLGCWNCNQDVINLTQSRALHSTFRTELNQSPLDCRSNSLTTKPPHHRFYQQYVRLLHKLRHAGRSASFHAGTIPASSAWSRDSSSSRVALVASHWEDPVQAVLAGSQVASGTHAGIYLTPSDIGCQHSRSIYTARFIVSQPRCAADMSTNWRQSLFCCCTASMEQAANGAETVAINTHTFCRDLKSFLFHSVYGHQGTYWLCDAPSVF